MPTTTPPADPPAGGDTRASYLGRTRATANLTRNALAAAAGISAGAVSEVLAGKRTNIGDDVYRAVATALGLDPATVLALPVQPPTPAAAPTDDAAVRRVRLADLRLSPLNPRKHVDHDKLMQLAQAIRAQGLLQNLVVRPGPQEDGRQTWVVVAGERRCRALQLLAEDGDWDPDAPLVDVRVIVADDQQHRITAIIENLQRVDPSPLEEARAYAELRELDPETYTTAHIANLVSVSQRHVQQRLQLLSLDEPARSALETGAIGVTQARTIAAAPKAVQGTLVEEARKGRTETELRTLKAAVTQRAVPTPAAHEPDKAAKAADLEARAREHRDREEASQRFRIRLVSALAAEPHLLRSLDLVERLRDGYGSALFDRHRAFPRSTLTGPYATPEVRDLVNARGVVPRRSNDLAAECGDPDTLLHCARTLDQLDVLALEDAWARALAETIAVPGAVGTLHPVLVSLARRLRIPIPAHLLPAGQGDLEDAAHAVREA